MCESLYKGVILCTTFEVQCTLLIMYTTVRSQCKEVSVIVCKLNNIRYFMSMTDLPAVNHQLID